MASVGWLVKSGGWTTLCRLSCQEISSNPEKVFYMFSHRPGAESARLRQLFDADELSRLLNVEGPLAGHRSFSERGFYA